jgi:hypothetical protein
VLLCRLLPQSPRDVRAVPSARLEGEEREQSLDVQGHSHHLSVEAQLKSTE